MPCRGRTQSRVVNRRRRVYPVEEVTTSYGMTRCDMEGLFRLPQVGGHIMWTPAGDKLLLAKLMICAHIGDCNLRSSRQIEAI